MGSTRIGSSTPCRPASSRRCTWRAASLCTTSRSRVRFWPTRIAIPFRTRRSICSNTPSSARRRRSSFSSATIGSRRSTRSSMILREFARAWRRPGQVRCMANRLLDRQLSLVEYLTSRSAIFGDEQRSSSPAAPAGLDLSLLVVEARFGYAKRMEKITAVLPKTFELLGACRDEIVRDFIASCPPATISRLDNARQFHGYLTERWRREAPEPPYLCDVAACELAYAAADADLGEPAQRANAGPEHAIRRSSSAILVRCAYDVRSVFEMGMDKAVPTKRETLLVVALPAGAAADPRIVEVPAAVFDLLAALDEWTEPPALAGSADLQRLLADLVEHGLIEVRA